MISGNSCHVSQSHVPVAIHLFFPFHLFRKFSLCTGPQILSLCTSGRVVCWLLIELNYKAKENIGASPFSGFPMVLLICFRAWFSIPNYFFSLAFMFHTIKGSKHAFKRCNCRWKLLGGKRHTRKGDIAYFESVKHTLELLCHQTNHGNTPLEVKIWFPGMW